MSTSALVPSNFTPKSFWKRPEGTPGKILMAGLTIGGVYGLYLALPFLLSVVWGTINLAIGLGILAFIGFVVTNPTIQNLAKNVFQSLCRGLATVYTTIDPIGILKNNLDDMRKAKAQLDQTIQTFAGSFNTLKANVSRKTAEIQQLMGQSAAAGKMLGTKSDPLERERIGLQKETYEQKAGLLMQAVQQLQGLTDQTGDMLSKFRHWSQVSDAKIDRTAMKVEIFAEQRKMILDAKKTLTIGQKLLRGDSEQLKLVDGAIEFLTEDAARTLGEIQEFNRFSDKMLTDIDIENNANADLARQRFAEFSEKLDANAKRPSAVEFLSGTTINATPKSLPAAYSNEVPNGNAYADVFQKK